MMRYLNMKDTKAKIYLVGPNGYLLRKLQTELYTLAELNDIFEKTKNLDESIALKTIAT